MIFHTVRPCRLSTTYIDTTGQPTMVGNNSEVGNQVYLYTPNCRAFSKLKTKAYNYFISYIILILVLLKRLVHSNITTHKQIKLFLSSVLKRQ